MNMLKVDNSPFKVQAKARANGGKIIMVGMPIRQDHLVDARAIRYVTKLANRPDVFSYYVPSPFAAHGRNLIIRYAKLKVPEVSNILFVDADTIPPEETLDKLLAHDKDIVTAVQPLAITGRGIVWNVMPYRGKKVSNFVPMNYIGLPDKLFRIAGCGFGAILVKRRVLEKMEWPYFKDIFTPNKWAMGQDMYFISKAMDLGFEIWADPNLQCEHSKKVDLLSLAPFASAGYGSHAPILAAIVSQSTGPILELGCGLQSTPLLHQMCLTTKRNLTSCESDVNWFETFLKYKTNWHQMLLVDNWDKCQVFDKKWDVVFVDHAPESRRITDVKRLKDKAHFIIIHDTKEAKYPVLDEFKYRCDYRQLKPWTTVVSNFDSLDFLKGE